MWRSALSNSLLPRIQQTKSSSDAHLNTTWVAIVKGQSWDDSYWSFVPSVLSRNDYPWGFLDTLALRQYVGPLESSRSNSIANSCGCDSLLLLASVGQLMPIQLNWVWWWWAKVPPFPTWVEFSLWHIRLPLMWLLGQSPTALVDYVIHRREEFVALLFDHPESFCYFIRRNFFLHFYRVSSQVEPVMFRDGLPSEDP